MKTRVLLSFVGTLFSISAHAANMSALITSAEATAEGDSDSISSSQSAESSTGTAANPGSVVGTSSPSSAGSVAGISRAGSVHTDATKSGQIAVSDFSLLMGPSFNQFSTSAPSAAQPYSGFSARHILRADYSLSRNVVVGPSLDLTENMYSSKQGTFVFNDPSMRLEINNLNRVRFGNERYSGAVWFSLYAPVSTRSQQMNEYTAISAAYIPRLFFLGSRHFLTGVASVKATFLSNTGQTAMVAPIQFVTAVQENYRVSPFATLFVMDHVNTNCGPQSALLSNDLGADSFRRRITAGSAVTNGIMTGAQFRVLSGVSLSPRLDWLTSQSLANTTVGLNAMFNLI